MSSVNEDSSVPVPNPSDSRPPELQRGTFTRVNTYIPEDLSIKLQSVPARIRKSVTEGYATNRWHGEPTPPSVSNARAQLGLGMGRPSIFQSPNEGFRRVATTPHVMPSNPAYTAIPRFADFGEAPSRPLPHVGGVRARVASLGNYPSAAPVPPASESGSPSKHPRTANKDSDSDSEPDVDAKSAAGSDAFGELFEAGEERVSSAGSNMFGSRPSALPMLDPAPRQPRQFQQTQSLPAGSLSFGIGTGHGAGTLDSLNEDEPWRQYDFSKYAAMPPE